MSRIVRIVGGTLAALLLIVVIAVAALLFVDADAYKGIVEARLSDALGRDVAIADLDIDYGRTTSISAAGVTVAGSGDLPQSRIEQVRLGLRVWLLLRRQLHIERLAAGPGSLHLQRRSLGGEEGSGGGLQLAHVEGVELSGLDITYWSGGRRTEAHVERLVVDHAEGAEKTTLQGRGTVGGAPFTLAGTTVQPDQVAGSLSGDVPIDITATLAEAKLTATGAVTPGPRLDMTVTAEAPEAAELLRLALIDVPAIGPLQAHARLQGGEQQTSVTDLRIRIGRDGGALQAQVAGRIESVTELQGIDLHFSASVPDLQAVEDLTRLPPQLTGRIEAKGRIVNQRDQLAATDLSVRAVDPERHDLQLTGDIGRLGTSDGLPVAEVNLTLSGTVKRLSALPAPADALLAQLGPAAINGRVTGGGEAFKVENLRLAAVQQAPMRLSATGEIGRLVLAPEFRLAEVDIEVGGTAPSLQALAPVLAALQPGTDPPVLPELGPVLLQARVTGNTAEGLKLSGLNASIFEGPAAGTTVQGEIGNLLAASGVDLQATLQLESLALLGESIGAPLPAISPFRANARISGDAPGLAVRDLDIQGGGEGGARLSASGSIANLAKAQDFSVQAHIQAPSLAALHGGLPQDSGAVDIDGTLTATPDGLVELRDARIAVGETGLSGTATLTPGEPRPVLHARLTSPHLRMVPLGADRPGGKDGGQQAGNGGGVFPKQPLPLDGLTRIDADVVLEADKVSYGNHHGNRLKLTITLKDGRLRTSLAELDFGHGAIQGDLAIDAAQDPPAWSLDGSGHGIEMATVSDLLDRPLRIDGQAKADVKLQSRGRSPDQIAGNLNGQAAFASGGGVIETGFINFIAADVLQQVLKRVASPQADTELECLLADFEISDGVANARTLFLSTDEIRIVGRGDIDLRREVYDLSLMPNPKDPALFSLSTRVHVTGPLSDPRITPDAGSLAVSALKAVVGNALVPGAGLLFPMLETGSGGKHPCEREVQQTASDAGLIGQALQGVGGVVRGVGQGVGGAVRGLGRTLGID